nr:hypothetical protein [Nannocystis sp.]
MYLHWPHDQVMGLDHGARRRWVEQVAVMNRARNLPESAYEPR